MGLADEVWQYRELQKFEEDELYTHVPWINEQWANHYPVGGANYFGKNAKGEYPHYRFTHVSLKDMAKIAYTQDDDKGRKDVQTKSRVGRYLKKFYPALGDQSIKTWVINYNEMYGTGPDIKFAITPEEIEYVYNHGPDSCMKKDSFTSGIHPCRIYGAGDLAVVYMVRNKKITSRAVCWPDKKLFSVIYGDRDRLYPALKQLNYKSGEMTGARLLQMEHSRSSKSKKIFIAPYLDGNATRVTVGEKFNYVGRDKKTKLSFVAQGTNGLGTPINFCGVCEKDLENRSCWNFAGEVYCETHFYDVAFSCSRCGDNVPIRFDHTEIDGCVWCYPCFLESYFMCSFCEKRKQIHLKSGSTQQGNDVCSRCLSVKSRNLKKCRRCNIIHSRDAECACGSASTAGADQIGSDFFGTTTISADSTEWVTFISSDTTII